MVKLLHLIRALQQRVIVFWGYSIRRQLLLSFGLVTLLVMASFSYLMYIQQRDFLYATDADRAQGLARALASSSASLLLTNDLAGLQEILHGFSDSPDLKFALVLSPQGEVMGATRPHLIGRYVNDAVSKRLLNVPAEFTILIDDDALIDVAMPIKVSSRHIGWARVEMTRRSSNANLNLLRATGLGFSLLAVMASFVMAAWLSWRLTGRFYHLIHIMKAVENGDRQVRSDITAKDEIGKLARSFNGMLDTLNESERALGRINRLYAAWTESSEVIVRQKSEALLLNNICQILAERVPFELVWIGVPGNDSWVHPVALSGISSDYLKTIRVSMDASKDEGQGPASIAIRAGMHKVFNRFLEDANAYWHAAAVKFNFNSVGAFPISRGGKIYGCIAVYSSELNFFSSEHVDLMSGLADDITFALDNLDREHQQRIAAIKLEQAATVFEHSKEGIVVTDANNKIISVNRSFVEITGYAPEDVVGKDPKILSSGLQSQEFYAHMWAAILQTGSWQGEIWDRRKNGEVYPEALTIIRVKNIDGVIINHLAIFSDISERKMAQERIQQLAHYDVLTGLPNRVLFTDRLAQAMISAQRNHNKIALLFLDIDRFKQINDTLGHGAGDRLLQNVGQRLLSCVREQDTVSRQGGDEFIVVLSDASALGAERVAQKILQSILHPYVIEQHDLRITASIGIALYPDHAQDSETLIKYADVAMYQAKESGRNCYLSFHPDMNESAYERLKLENALRGAQERDELRVHYQAQVNLEDGRIIGCEALVRWQHPELGMIHPEKFIPLAEETGLIISINQWVLEHAIKQCRAWRDAGFQALTMSVNLSALQFRQHNLLQQVKQLLDKYELPPDVLDLELTEGILMQGVERTLATLHELSAMGVILSLDDFGTGYSSLSYLKRFPIQQLKIDQSFVRDVTSDTSDATMVRTIILMANSLKLDVIAEGVETKEQAAFLMQSGCERAQGYHFRRPVTAEEFEKLLQFGQGTPKYDLPLPEHLS
jgi:diguanylate cyclase (GGDEF)-like protein/PAS domain S-box-containing protein